MDKVQMTDEKVFETLKQYIEQGNCFTTEVRDILIAYKNSGGQKEMVQQMLEKFKGDNEDNDTIQDRVDDILDIVTAWCSPHMKVWN
ncbi:MAG: hypothetical protein WBP45_08560 [Daejeonella sp.]